MIRPATIDDAARIAEIYNHYVLHSTITFEEEAVSVEDMQRRISEILAELPWLVWVEGQTIAGFASASKWKGRCACRYSVESTVYVAADMTGKRIGSSASMKWPDRSVTDAAPSAPLNTCAGDDRSRGGADDSFCANPAGQAICAKADAQRNPVRAEKKDFHKTTHRKVYPREASVYEISDKRQYAAGNAANDAGKGLT